MSMKAAVQAGAEGVRIAEVEIPRPGPDEVQVRVRACGLNRADLGMAAGHAHGAHGGAGTLLGLEWAGEVMEVGTAVSDLRAGDRVMCSGKGGFAEYAVADRGRVMRIPRADMGFEQAATLPVALQTMHDALVTNGRLQRGESVLIQGASSGVGLMALQIARLMGAGLVIGTSGTPTRRARLQDFGAHVALDSHDPQWPEQVRAATGGQGVDVIIDQLAGTRAEFDFDVHALKRLHYIGVTFRTRSVDEVREINRRMQADLGEALAAGSLALPIDQRFAFADVRHALDSMARNAHFGKIVLTMP